MEGWIKLHRGLLESDVWTCEPFSRGQAWVDLLLLANHKDSFFYKRGNKIDVKRGQLGRSVVELSDRWKWSRNKVNKFLKDLEKEQQIKQHKSHVTQIVTIINYDEYQEKGQQSLQQKGSRKAAEGQQKDTYKNVKNDNNEKNEKNLKQNYKPDFNKIFPKLKTRIHQDWIVEVFESYKSFSPTCEKTVSEFMEGTMKYSIFEFCKSCKYNTIKFYSESAAIKYWKESSQGYISDIDTWRKKLKAMKQRSINQLSDINS